jgi:hypothetical protein
MRPDEFMRQDAERWTEAVALKNAMAEAVKAARDEQEGERKIQEMIKNGGRSSKP